MFIMSKMLACVTIRRYVAKPIELSKDGNINIYTIVYTHVSTPSRSVFFFFLVFVNFEITAPKVRSKMPFFNY